MDYLLSAVTHYCKERDLEVATKILYKKGVWILSDDKRNTDSLVANLEGKYRNESFQGIYSVEDLDAKIQRGNIPSLVYVNGFSQLPKAASQFFKEAQIPHPSKEIFYQILPGHCEAKQYF